MPLVGTLDLLAVLQGKKTLLVFGTGVNDGGEHGAPLRSAHRLSLGAEPDEESKGNIGENCLAPFFHET